MTENAEPRPIKVAIVGGGCAALTTAFELTRPEHEGRYAVTVYQMGWRLGGKGASGRNAQKWNRTEEHGLHVWMGFYENAFRVIRDAYAELAQIYAGAPEDRQSRYLDWQEAFMPDPWVGVADESRGVWRTWSASFPATAGLPGDPLDGAANPFTLQSYLARGVELLRALVRSTFTTSTAAKKDAVNRELEFSELSPRAIVDKIASLLRVGMLTGAGALYEAMAVLKVALSASDLVPDGDFKTLKFAEAIADNLKRQTEDLLTLDENVRPKLELIELVVTVIVGLLRDQLLSDPRGLDVINDEDCRAWLRRHGASERALDSSIVRALYDMAFVGEPFTDADAAELDAALGADAGPASEPGLAAGQALRGALRMFFTYRGALFWKMRAGMGDVVFSPLYEVLKQRGVRFEFFHRLADVRLSPPEAAGKPHVMALEFEVQAGVREQRELGRGGALAAKALADGEYYPLDADGCWPARPDCTQLTDAVDANDLERQKEAGSALRTRRLAVGEDFDFVVLGVAVGAIRYTCRDLLERDPRWKAMVENVRTTATQALQLWTSEGLERLSDAPTPTTVAGLDGYFDTWSDMTHVIAEEGWPSPPADADAAAQAGQSPQGLAYFCGVFPAALENVEPTPELAASWHADAADETVRYLDEVLPRLWPRARDQRTGGFRWDLLVRPPGADVPPRASRLDAGDKRKLVLAHYLGLNVKQTDRYVLARPGTLEYRISPLDDSYDNLTIAGDWTDCGFNEGCVEAAVMSGRLASHALSCFPELHDIVGYDHP